MPKTIRTLSAPEQAVFLGFLEHPIWRQSQPRHIVRNYLMAMLMLDTGIRVGELVKLLIDDIYFGDHPVNTLIIRSEIAKTKVERCVPLTDRVKDVIETYNHRTYTWRGTFGNHWAFWAYSPKVNLTVRQVQRIIRFAAHHSIGRPVTPHQLRHTFATRLMEKTNIRVVQALLGHKSLQSTQIYTHPNDQHLKEAISKI